LSKVKSDKGNCPFTFHSFDLVSQNELVTACDMADVPLPNKSVDVCVFCLSLMGTNLADFMREAHRVLKDNGRVKIAEVRSRIEYSHSQQGKKNNNKESTSKKGKSAGTLDEFVYVLEELGFECVKKDQSNKMFLVLELEKNGKKPNKRLAFSAKPCIYKRR
jgi:ribosomal RNA-processing protein 8